MPDWLLAWHAMRSAVVVPPSSAAPVPRRCDGCVDGVLVVHNHPVGPHAPDVIESVRAYGRHSRHAVWTVNTRLGFPRGLGRLRFRAVILHYTLFYAGFAPISRPWRAWLDGCRDAYTIALFQDEQAYTRERFAFCDRYAIDSVYTLLAPEQFAAVYGAHTRVPRIVSYHPGYVSERLLENAARLVRPDAERCIDVGYRGRRPDAAWGPPAREKYDIAVQFGRRAIGTGLALDIETDEAKRIYGRRWYAFVADCRGMLGTESGASRFDMGGPGGTEVPYRTISPRHLEAAAFRVCQILYEGQYSGVLEPDVHYLPLAKDFSNFDDVLRRFRDPDVRAELTENAHRDLIASGALAYQRFVAEVDAELTAAGLPAARAAAAPEVAGALYPSKAERRARKAARAVRDAWLPRVPGARRAVHAVRGRARNNGG